MNEIDKIKSLKSFLQTLEYLYDNKKWLVTCEQLRELFYNDKNKRYNWLTIIQLTGLKYKGSTEYTAEKIGEIIGYSASTVENEKSKIVETIENMNEWKKPLFIVISDYKPSKTNITPIIGEFAKHYEAEIIILLNSLGLKSYISIGEHIVDYTKTLFDLDIED